MPNGKTNTLIHLVAADYRGLRLDFMLKMNNHMIL